MLKLFKQKNIEDNAPDMEEIYRRGVAKVEELIAPSALKINANYIQVGEIYARTIFVIAYPHYLGTNWFSPIVNLDFSLDISMFIHPMETGDVLKNLRKSATQVQSTIHLEEESGKIRDPMLETAMQNIEELRTELQQGTEKFFRFGLYVTVYEESVEKVDKITKLIEATLEAQMVYVKSATLRMEQGFSSTLPLANDELDSANNLNTSPLSTTFPFTSSELSSSEGILYGINRHNNSLILFDRFNMENFNMVVFAKSGAGKSYAVKLEILRSMMMGVNVIVIDPENEYKYLCETVGGSFVKISLNSHSNLNPFDLPKIKGDEDDTSMEDVLRGNIANLLGLFHMMLGSLTQEEDSILGNAIKETYFARDITAQSNYSSLTATSFPTMSDLHEVLCNMEGADSLAIRMEKYTEGIFSGFLNKPTNINIDNQLTVFNIRDMEGELRPIAMYIILQFIWNEMRVNRKKRLVVVDEAWIMMQHEDAASFLFGIAKRCRKYYTGLTTITQDINDFMNSHYGKPVVSNSSIQLLLRQSPASIDIVSETFYLTDQEKFLLLESNVGEGIFFAGNKRAAVKVVASYSEDQIITSDPKQLMEIEEAKKEFNEENK